jgi:hypothetical protein
MSTLVEKAVNYIVDTVKKQEIVHVDLFDLTASSINELHENAGTIEAFDSLMAQLNAMPRPITSDQALAVISQAVLYCIDLNMPWYRCKTILEEVWNVGRRW